MGMCATCLPHTHYKHPPWPDPFLTVALCFQCQFQHQVDELQQKVTLIKGDWTTETMGNTDNSLCNRTSSHQWNLSLQARTPFFRILEGVEKWRYSNPIKMGGIHRSVKVEEPCMHHGEPRHCWNKASYTSVTKDKRKKFALKKAPTLNKAVKQTSTSLPHGQS